jgi:hypothetical protein
MVRYGAKAKKKVTRALHKRKQGTLKSGSGRTVKSRKQAIAIGLSEARSEGGKVPARKPASKKARKRPTTRKSGARKKSTRKSSARKSATRK